MGAGVEGSHVSKRNLNPTEDPSPVRLGKAHQTDGVERSYEFHTLRINFQSDCRYGVLSISAEGSFWPGPGWSEDDSIVLVVEAEDAKKRSASTAQSKGLPEAVTPGPRYVYYRLYEEEGAMASKTSFDPDDSSLGRIDTFSIVPPQTVSSLKSQIVKAEGIADRKIQLFGDMDGEVPMNDNDHMSLRAQVYPGHVEDEPITLVCSPKKAEKTQKDTQLVPEPSFNKKLKGSITWNPNPTVQSDWLPFVENEIMFTDGVKTKGCITGLPSDYLFHRHISNTRTIFFLSVANSPYSGYIAMNSAGRKGFVYDSHSRLC
ncbi:uncharacterized protein LACBIDRAFT_335382 [Laccaria bicolor S238N-H82]|uniref:Predicted protein n=1 Tax=Laccaria bicolor (strain S238N-H82 / ATCC MYA-4686) TaxID=486041 RepID=B0E268_LACBS|nr:uncharacterized protein LACBIDRAFT_335382 [Laccaria bicolor S238N-H82]EDQ99085.1 predicted protein [Laccaria bicolor S238N-H82]|eukprot:XP_001890287.1 predicted protein [Laccaria bicolor S238N-H82]